MAAITLTIGIAMWINHIDGWWLFFIAFIFMF